MHACLFLFVSKVIEIHTTSKGFGPRHFDKQFRASRAGGGEFQGQQRCHTHVEPNADATGCWLWLHTQETEERWLCGATSQPLDRWKRRQMSDVLIFSH